MEKSKWIIPGKEKNIHFYNKFKNGRVVSKIKELGEKTKSSGKQCSVGQNKNKLIKIMDQFLNFNGKFKQGKTNK